MATQILGETKAPVESLITHRFPMARFREAVQAFRNKGQSHAIKIVLDHPR